MLDEWSADDLLPGQPEPSTDLLRQSTSGCLLRFSGAGADSTAALDAAQPSAAAAADIVGDTAPLQAAATAAAHQTVVVHALNALEPGANSDASEPADPAAVGGDPPNAGDAAAAAQTPAAKQEGLAEAALGVQLAEQLRVIGQLLEQQRQGEAQQQQQQGEAASPQQLAVLQQAAEALVSPGWSRCLCCAILLRCTTCVSVPKGWRQTFVAMLSDHV